MPTRPCIRPRRPRRQHRFFNQHWAKAAEKIAQHSFAQRRNRDFRYALQAKVDIRDQRIVGFEALARWVDAQGRVHPPGKFLALASELGLLDGITNIILDALIDDLPRLDACFGTDVSYSINISAAQAAKIAFMEQFVQRIAGTGRAGSFTLELTEEAFVAAGPFQSRIFPLLREVGVGVSIDDFGTGYSSLSILATSPPTSEGRSLLITSIHQRPRSQSILRAIGH